MSFDTLAFAKRLAAAGMNSGQAQALAEALNDIVFDTLATKSDLRELQLATKSDLRELQLATKSDLRALQLATKADMRELEQRLMNKMTVRMGAMTAATIGILGALKIVS